MNTPEATIGVPPTAPSIVQYKPPSDNGAPPALLQTQPTKKEGPSLKDIVLTVFSIVFTLYAIYYGWILGQQKGRDYLLYVQSFGGWLRSWFVRPV